MNLSGIHYYSVGSVGCAACRRRAKTSLEKAQVLESAAGAINLPTAENMHATKYVPTKVGLVYTYQTRVMITFAVNW